MTFLPISHRIWIPVLVAATSAGCAVTVKESKTVGRLSAAPDNVTLIWAEAKPAKFDAVPAFGAVLIAPLGSPPPNTYRNNLDAEFNAFGAALKQQLPAAPLPEGSTLVTLSPHHDAARLEAEIAGARKESAVLVLYPEGVSAYCSAGCYAYTIRVNYLAPSSRATIWTGRMALPPKQNHRDSFEPLALQFLTALSKQLDQEHLLARSGPRTDPVRAVAAAAVGQHRKRIPAPTGFAPGDDVAAVPVRAEGKERYRHYLTLPSPKAFVVYQGGGWRFFSADPDAMTHALDRCARDSARCWLTPLTIKSFGTRLRSAALGAASSWPIVESRAIATCYGGARATDDCGPPKKASVRHRLLLAELRPSSWSAFEQPGCCAARAKRCEAP